MKAIEIDSSQWTYEMRRKAIVKLNELEYTHDENGHTGKESMTAYSDGVFVVYDYTPFWPCVYDTVVTYEELMALTKEDVQ